MLCACREGRIYTVYFIMLSSMLQTELSPQLSSIHTTVMLRLALLFNDQVLPFCHFLLTLNIFIST